MQWLHILLAVIIAVPCVPLSYLFYRFCHTKKQADVVASDDHKWSELGDSADPTLSGLTKAAAVSSPMARERDRDRDDSLLDSSAIAAETEAEVEVEVGAEADMFLEGEGEGEE